VRTEEINDAFIKAMKTVLFLIKLIGCKPRLFYWRDLKLTKELFFGSHLPAFYRLSNSATKKSAINSIKSLPIAYSKKRAITILFFILIFNPISRITNLLSVK